MEGTQAKRISFYAFYSNNYCQLSLQPRHYEMPETPIKEESSVEQQSLHRIKADNEVLPPPSKKRKKKRKRLEGEDQSSEVQSSEETTLTARPALYKSYHEDGDLILTVGEHKIRILVHSIIMMAASPVLKKLLKPLFTEAKHTPIEVELPEDTSTATSIICNVLHHGDGIVSEQIYTAEVIHAVALFVSKYDLFSRLCFVIKHWLEKLRSSVYKNADDAWLAAWAAYWFRDESFFYTFTTSMMSHKVSYLDKASAMKDEALGLRLCCKNTPYEPPC